MSGDICEPVSSGQFLRENFSMSDEIHGESSAYDEDVHTKDSRIADATGIRVALYDLQRSPGWELLMEVNNKRLTILEADLFAPTRGMDDMVSKEFIRGSVNELRRFRDMSESIRTDAQDIIDMLAPREED